MANKRKISIKHCSINIGGMSNRSQFCLNKFVDEEGIDILCMQETGTCESEKLEIENMTHITDTNKATNRGAALYVNNRYSLTKLDEIAKLSNHVDSCWALIIIENQRYIVGSIYVKHNYKPAFKEIISMLNLAEKRKVDLKASGIILSGDYNARHISWGDFLNDDYGNKLVELLDHTRYSISIPKSPTFLCINALNGGSFIDFSIISNSIVESVCNCITDEGTELYSGAPKRGHVPVITEIAANSLGRSTPYCEKLDISKINWESWTNMIEADIECNRIKIESENNPYALWNTLNGIITKATNTFGIRKKCCQYSKPYWTKSLTEKANLLRYARKCFIKRNTNINLRKLDEARDQFNEERKTVCQDFILNKVKSMNSSQSQQFWKEFNKIFKKKINQKIDPLEDGENSIITEPKAMEECLFSVFFEAKHLIDGDFDEAFYLEVNKLHESIINKNFTQPEQNRWQEDIYNLNREITNEEISKAIKHTGKSVDPCDFHPTMFQHLRQGAKNTLKKLFNMCLSTCTWVWEAAEVIFLRKSGKDSYAKPGSYRPICLTSYIGKLKEAIIANRIEQLLIMTNQVDPDQEGFSKSKNTIRYLNRLHLGIKADIEQKLTVICIFIDFEKAFDSVWKQGMIVKLNKLGICGNVLKLINNFLFSRKVALNVNGEVGDPRQSTEYGLPQGSVLSPTLFKIFVSDFVEEVSKHKDIVLYKFADDGTIKITAKNSKDCVATLETVLRYLESWAKKWRMKYNCDKNKTEIIAFNTAEQNKGLIPQEFLLGGKTIYRVCKTKVLGLTIDEDLTYIPHSQEVLKGLHAVWATLCKYSSRHWGFTQRVMLELVKTLFISKMKYAAHIWMTESNTTEIRKLWYHIIKSIIGAVLNLNQSVAEVILGVPPILIQAKVDGIKHFLKLNLSTTQQVQDRYTSFLISSITDPNTPSMAVINKFKPTFKFLQWKARKYNGHFTANDKLIIEGNTYEKFFQLSSKSCSYTSKIMNTYIETELWAATLKNQFHTEGYAKHPIPSCAVLPIPSNTTREIEVLLMSLYYKNNLLNDSMWKIGKVSSPLCSSCKEEEETADHIIFRCNSISVELHEEAKNNYRIANHLDENDYIDADFIGLLNASRHQPFTQSCLKIIKCANLRTSIIL